MINDIVLQYKKEKEYLLSQNYVKRDKLDVARKALNSNLVKVITGPRRAGKSVFAMLLLKDTNFAYLNFDDENLLKIENQDEIITGIFEVYKKPQFILFDEIQNLRNWELFVNKLQRRGYNLILTGSNAKLLSQELASVLTGRHITIDILPFSFSEYLRANNFSISQETFNLPEAKGSILRYLSNYLKSGGFPEAVVKNLDVKLYLDTLFDAVLLKDVVKRYKVRYSQKLYDLALYLVSNFASEFSFTKLKNNLDFSSVNTVQKYLEYIEEAYLVFILNRFSFKVKEQIRAPKKMFVVDPGFILAKAFQVSPNIGRLMENLVLVELFKKGYKLNENVFYYKTRNQKEVDNVLKQGPKVKTIMQISYQANDISTEKRELKAMIEASEELDCNDLILITWEKEGETKINGKTIKNIPLWEWLIKSI
jgi:predicted AAA+ superfamily ATPase